LRSMKDEGKGDIRLAEAVDPAGFPHLHSDHSLDIALERMGSSGLRVLPVVSRFNMQEMLGVVYLSDILNAYRVAIQSPDHPAVRQPQTESEETTTG
jgi:CBS domain-containing protein